MAKHWVGHANKDITAVYNQPRSRKDKNVYNQVKRLVMANKFYIPRPKKREAKYSEKEAKFIKKVEKIAQSVLNCKRPIMVLKKEDMLQSKDD